MTDHPHTPPLAGLYEELQSALAGLAALHRALAAHPDCRSPCSHLTAACLADVDAVTFAACAPLAPLVHLEDLDD